MKTAKYYRKLKLMRDGINFTDPSSGHYTVEREKILLPISLAEENNLTWKNSGLYYDEIPEEIEEEVVVIETVKVEPTKTENQTEPRKPSAQEIRAKAKELGMAITLKTTKEQMLDYIRENINK